MIIKERERNNCRNKFLEVGLMSEKRVRGASERERESTCRSSRAGLKVFAVDYGDDDACWKEYKPVFV